MKGKHLTRSHAMRESTSPPRTPTPRSEQHANLSATTPNGQINYQQQQQHVIDGNDHSINNNSNNNNNNHNSNNNNNKMHAQSNAANSNSNNNNRGNSPLIETSPVIVTTSQHKQPQQQQQQQQQNVAPLSNEAEFPKLTPPKKSAVSGGGGGGGGGSCGGSGGSGGQNNRIAAAPTSGEVIANSNNKIEYSNNNNNNSGGNGKKYIADMKANGNVAIETHKHGGNTNINNNKQQQYIADCGTSTAGATSPVAATPIYNSGMNYQLNADRQERHDQHHQQPQHQQQHNHHQRNESQNSNDDNIADQQHHQQQQQQQSQQHHYERGGGAGGGGGGGKKHRANTNSKSTKPRLKNLIGNSNGGNDGSNCGGNGGNGNINVVGNGGSNSGGGGGGVIVGGVVGNNSNNSSSNTSGFISRENSGEQYTDHGGTDLLSFFKETLNKNPKDRHLLIKIEKDLIEFVQDKSATRSELRFPAASSYNRMLIHRTAAYFGMEHNVDTETQQCVIVAFSKNTRIPEIRFKGLLRDHREDSRKSILKRDTHSFDEPRQSTYLCPDRGMLDRKAKSFEEREEDYERTRSRIFSRTHMENSVGGDGSMHEENYGSWSNSAEQQQRQARATGKLLKMQNSTESRDGGRSGGGAVPKAHSFGGYGGPPSAGGPSLPRGDSTTSNKSGVGGRGGFAKQDSTGSTNTPWRLSPSSSGSIYHFDPSNLPANQAIASGGGAGGYQQQQQQQQQQPNLSQQQSQQQLAGGNSGSSSSNNNSSNSSANYVPYRKGGGGAGGGGAGGGGAGGGGGTAGVVSVVTTPVQQQQQQAMYANEAGSVGGGVAMTTSLTESYSDEGNGGQEVSGITYEYVPSAQVGAGDGVSFVVDEQAGSNETLHLNSAGDECDNAASACMSITTTSTKNYDRIEVQKYKHQATSPNIPCDKDELDAQENDDARETPTQSQTPVAQVPPQQQTPQQAQQINCDATLSPSSTPYSSSELSAKHAPEEPKATTWTYTQSYQAPDGSTVFHTTTAPNSAPYCTTYQQAPDGSIYAVPQGMIYAYPQPSEGEVQGYLMPVFDPSQQRTADAAAAAAAGLIPAGAQAIYQTPGGAAAVMPVATATYPAAQFATAANGAPIYQGPVIYSSDQFAHAGAAGPAGAQQQQLIPTMTTYPLGYPYPYNGYWGQTMTYYVSAQQPVAAAPLVSAAPPPTAAPPPSQAPQTVQQLGAHQAHHHHHHHHHQPQQQPQQAHTQPPTGIIQTQTGAPQAQQVAGGMQLAAITTATSTQAAGPLQSGNSVGGSIAAAGTSYHTSGGTTYYGTGRVKRTPGGGSIHYTGNNNGGYHPHNAVISAAAAGTGGMHHHHHAAAAHHAQPHHVAGPTHATQLIAATALPGNGAAGGAATTTYHAVPTITLAAGSAPNLGGCQPNANDLNAAANGATAMYTLQTPHGTTLVPTNVFPYAAAAAAAAVGQSGQPPPVPASNTTATVAAVMAASAQVQQQSAVITTTPFYPAGAGTALMETPTAGGSIIGGTFISHPQSNISQSAPSTPHGMSTQPGAIGLTNAARQTPLFSTPPIQMTNSANSSSGNGSGGLNSNTAGGGGGYHSNSSTPHYYQGSQQHNNGNGGHDAQHSTYASNSYDKRNNGSGPNRKPHAYMSRQNSNNGGSGGGYNGSRTPLLNSNNEPTPRASPSNSSNNGGGGGYHAPHRTHPLNKRNGDNKQQAPLISGPPPQPQTNTGYASLGYHPSPSPHQSNEGKPPVRLNAGAASFRHKPNANYEFRRSVSQRNSPGTNGSSSNESNNNSPNSIANNNNSSTSSNVINVSSSGTTSTPIVSAASNANNSMQQPTNVGGGATPYAVVEPQPTAPQSTPATITAAPSLYITGRGSHIPPQLHHAAGAAASHQQQTTATAAVLGGAAVAAALGTYNPGAASGVYFKYGQTYFAHPSVTLPNSRRSPSTELGPPIAQVAGMYPATMMIPGAARHAPGRHPNPNYKGTRPR